MVLSKKIVFVLGLCCFSVSLFFAWTWAEERIAFGDAAYQLFSILRNNDFAIQVMRFGSAMTQIFPLAGSKLHLSLQTIVNLYSLSFEFIAFAAFLIILFRFNNVKLATVLILTKTLITTHTFFWIQSELLQGIIILVVFLAWLKNKYIERLSIYQYCLLFFFSFTLAFVHPLILFPFLFCMFYILISATEEYQSKIIKTSIALFLVLIVSKATVLKNAYDSGAMSGLNNFILHFPHYLSTPSNRQFLQHCYANYYLLPFVFIALLLILAYAKKCGTFSLTLLFPLCYFMIVQISNYEGTDFVFRIESFYVPLALMLSFALVETLSQFNRAQKAIYSLVAITIIFFVWRINIAYPLYSEQLVWNKKFIETHLHEKLVISEAELLKKNRILPWAFPYQSWVISTLHFHRTASFASVKEKNDLDWAFSNNHLYLTPWGNFEYWQLPQPYFIFTDDSSYYKNYQLAP